MTTAAALLDTDNGSGAYPPSSAIASFGASFGLRPGPDPKGGQQTQSPAQQARHVLIHRVMTGFVVPLVSVGNAGEFFAFWNEHFGEAAPLFHAIVRLADDDQPTGQALELVHDPKTVIGPAMARIEERVISLAGIDAGSSFAFSQSTMLRALARLRRLIALPRPNSSEGRVQDGRCASRFNRAHTIFSIALLCLVYVVEDDLRVPPSVLAAILEVLRIGAMRSYEHAADGLAVRLEGQSHRPAPEPTLSFDVDSGELDAMVDEHLEDAESLIDDTTGHG